MRRARRGLGPDADLPRHDHQLGDQQRREQHDEQEEGRYQRAGVDSRDGGYGRQQVLDGPRLASYLGDDPARHRREIGQRDRPQHRVQHPPFAGQRAPVAEEQDGGEQQDEVAAQSDHHAERIEDRRHVRNDVGRLLEKSVSDRSELLLDESFSDGIVRIEQLFESGLLLLVACPACLAVAFERLEGLPSEFHALLGRRNAVLFVTVYQIVDARNEGVRVAESHQRQHFRNFDPECERAVVARADGPVDRSERSDRDQSRLLAPVVEGFHGRQLHRLRPSHLHGRAVARHRGHQREEQPEHRCDDDAPACELLLAFAQQIPCADADDYDGRQHVGRRDRVEELVDRHRRKHYVPERGHLLTGGLDVERRADGRLHPCVGYQNPQRREIGADGRDPSGCQMKAFRYLVPAEKHHGEKRSFQEKGHNALDGQRGTENVADEMGVVRPVRAELELEDQARRHADREVDREDADPEFRRALPEGIARAVVERFHDRADETEPERQRHEQPVVDRRHRELRPRPVYHVHQIGRGKYHIVKV